MANQHLGIISDPTVGKDTVAQMVRDLIAPHTVQIINYSDRMKEELNARGVPLTRQNFQNESRRLRGAFGEDHLGQVVRYRAIHSQADLPILTGIRRAEDIMPLRTLPGSLYLLYLTAPAKKRWEWQQARRQNADEGGKSFEQFLKEDQDECEIHIRQIGQDLADGRIDNNGTLDELRGKVRLMLRDRFNFKV